MIESRGLLFHQAHTCCSNMQRMMSPLIVFISFCFLLSFSAGICNSFQEFVEEQCTSLPPSELSGLLNQLGVSLTSPAGADCRDEQARGSATVAGFEDATSALLSWAHSHQREPTAFATLLQAMHDSNIISHPTDEERYARSGRRGDELEALVPSHATE